MILADYVLRVDGKRDAGYQKCRLVRDLALSLGIELLFLPTYSPNLNRIERRWKFVKKQCLYSIYYNDFAVFKQAISACLAQTNTVHKATLDSLLTPHPSPHFASARAVVKASVLATAALNACTSGASLCSGMFGISS